jgi:hypothetical protein
MEPMVKRLGGLLVAGGAVLVLVAGGVAYSVGLVSCGSSDSSAGSGSDGGSKASGTPDPNSAFVGSWDIAGTTYSSCSGQPETTQSLTRVWVLSSDASGALSLKMDELCTFVLDVEGNVASMKPGQSCQEGDAGGGSSTTLSSLSITLSGATATIQTRGSVRVTISGNSFDCAMRGEYSGQRRP